MALGILGVVSRTGGVLVHSINGPEHTGFGDSVTRSVGAGAGDVAAGDAPAAAGAAAASASDPAGTSAAHAGTSITHGAANGIADIADSRFPTTDEKAALAGTSGSPASGNKFVTNTDSRNSDARDPNAHKDDHQDGGADKVSVASLSGVLADNQPSIPHTLGGAKHLADVVADLNAKISDGQVMAYDAALDLYHMAGAKAGITGTGALARKMLNKTSAATVKGSVISASDATARAFKLQEDQYDAIGVVIEAGVADGAEAWIVIHGPVQVLLENATAALLEGWGFASTVDGRANLSLAAPAGGGFVNAAEHFKEIGHGEEANAGGSDQLVWVSFHTC